MDSSVEVEQEEEGEEEEEEEARDSISEKTNPLVSPQQANQGECVAGYIENADDDCGDDGDDSETIEFDIEIVSNDSNSERGSLADLRDSECVIAKEDTPLKPVESTIVETTNYPESTKSDANSEIQVHADNQPSQETTNESEDDDDDDELEYVLEVIEENGPSVLMNEQSADHIETTTNNNNNNNKNDNNNKISDEIVPVEIVSSQSESDQEIRKSELELEETRQIPIVNDQLELEGIGIEAQEIENKIELEDKVEEMKLEENLLAQVLADSTIPQQIKDSDNDLKELPHQSELIETDDANVDADTDANADANADIPPPPQESDLEKPSVIIGEPVDQSPAAAAAEGTTEGEVVAPMISNLKLVSQDFMEPVGSKNICEIYKDLKSDSVLIIGCRPEGVIEAEHQKLDDTKTTVANIGDSKEEAEKIEETSSADGQAEASAEQRATFEVLTAPEFSLPQIVELQQSIPQSPEITIDHSPDVEATPYLMPPMSRDSRRCSVDEDLEWEFDNEPVFEKREIKVKRGKEPRNEYELGGELGRGKFGTVYRCIHRESGKNLAAKFVLTRRKEDREDVEREVEIMSQLQHKRLLQLYDAFDNGTNEMCLITELVEGGELFERIIDDDFDLTERKAAIFMRQICEGVEYMHSLNIVHMDMKPENILCISRTGNRIKLIDFGLARLLDPNESLRVMFGTPDFAAPEVLCYDTVSLATDMWSVGVICYVLLSGLSPFMGNNDMETMANVTRATYDFDEAAFDPITDLAKDFISKLLVKEQTKRLKPGECLKHAWLAKGGVQLEAAARERRKSIAIESQLELFSANLADAAAAAIIEKQVDQLLESSITISLDKRNLKKYVVRRKWHKTVHAIMALGRMGAKFKDRLIT